MVQKYGITLDEWDKMLIAQCGRCACCGDAFKNIGEEPSLDHDHGTGKNRELLCINCNVAAGYLLDSPERCRLLEVYLIKHGK